MKKLLGIFSKSFLFPFVALLGGIPAGAAGAQDDGTSAEPEENANGPEAESGDGENEGNGENEGKEKPVEMTQAELDKLINRKFREGLRKGKAQANPKEGAEADDQTEKRLLEANKRLLAGVVREKAAEASLTAKGAKFALLALQAAGTEGYLTDDGVDEEAVSDFLAQFAEENAELTKERPAAGTGGAANPKREKPQKTSVGERLAKSVSQQTKSSFFSN